MALTFGTKLGPYEILARRGGRRLLLIKSTDQKRADIAAGGVELDRKAEEMMALPPGN